MKILCDKQRRAVYKRLRLAYAYLQRVDELVKGAYGSHDLRSHIVAPVLRDLACAVDQSHPGYGMFGKVGDMLPPLSPKLRRMDGKTKRELGLTPWEGLE